MTNFIEFEKKLEMAVDELPESAREKFKADLDRFVRAYLRGEQPSDRFVLHKASEALEPQPPVRWIVDRVFSEGSVNLVVGEAKSKKTYSLLDASVAVAAGEKWLDFETQQSNVLIIDEESGLRRMKRRLGDVLRGRSANSDIPIQFVTLAGLNLSNDVDGVQARSLISQTNARFVVIDALIDVLGDADENDASQVQLVFHKLRQIAEETGACIVIIHHNGKNGAYRGSSAMKGAVDLLLSVSSRPDSLDVQFAMEAPRDTEPFKFAAAANFGEGTFCLSPSTPSEKPEHFSKSQDYVIRYLTTHGESSIRSITGNADACTSESARQAVYSLVKHGKVRRTNGGGSGVTALYDLMSRGSPNL